jgi:1-phosphatidylinositol-4-phosphate 5-kinase
VASRRVTMTRFVDYAPFMFRQIRELKGISTATYLRSVGPEQLIGNMILGNLSSLSEQSTEGKSGAFFYYTADGRFMIKTITKKEQQLLKTLLKNYYHHLVKYPNSMIIKFFGLHSLIIRKRLAQTNLSLFRRFRPKGFQKEQRV